MQDRIFEASNGIKVRRYSYAPGIWWEASDPDEEETALREFFQAERDEELGRWRWPENPDYVVWESVRSNERDITVLGEATGFVGYYDRKRLPEISWDLGWAERAAHAYFAAHPESKPWHSAEPGEVWLFKRAGDSEPKPFIWTSGGWSNGSSTLGTKCNETQPYGDAHDPEFTPVRIWPQEKENNND